VLGHESVGRVVAVGPKVQTFRVGQMVGVQVSAIKPGSLFEQAGLQNGDTITEINGQPVSGPEGAPQLFQKLTQGGDIRLGVQDANGSRRDIDFSQR
jgi:general secretion pathway protein C